MIQNLNETTRTHLRLLILLHYATKRQTPPAPLKRLKWYSPHNVMTEIGAILALPKMQSSIKHWDLSFIFSTQFLVILLCHSDFDVVHEIMTQAYKKGMTSPDWVWIFYNRYPDAETQEPWLLKDGTTPKQAFYSLKQVFIQCIKNLNGINMFHLWQWSIIYQWKARIFTFLRIYTFMRLFLIVLIVFCWMYVKNE